MWWAALILAVLLIVGLLVIAQKRRAKQAQLSLDRQARARSRESVLPSPPPTASASDPDMYVERPPVRIKAPQPQSVHVASKPGAPITKPVSKLPEVDRLRQVVTGEGEAMEQAWAALKQVRPSQGQAPIAMQTMARLASDLGEVNRWDLVREIYEHMVDLDPTWPDIKALLTQAREHALNQLTPGVKPIQAAPAVQNGPRIGPTQIGRYLVRGEIGRGAMGAVYLATNPQTNEKVAIKTMALHREFEGDALRDAQQRFQREAQMAGRLAHPDIVQIYESGEDQGMAYIAMEYVDGTDLGFFTKQPHLLPVRQVLSIVARVAEALAYAHTQGVTHRDIKPANIMVDLDRGVVKVMDFGVARVTDAARTRTGVVLGTPSYMSPEQLSGQPVDGRSDLYSLGVTLFQLLTGQLPYQTQNMASLMRAISQEIPPPVSTIRPDLPGGLDDVVALALQKHPNTRYSNGHQLAEDLRSI